MKCENSIEVHNVTKKFKVYYDKGTSAKERILFRNRNRYEERQVLRGISFDVKKGEAIGLIGHNGCGKSTTLKLLTKIMYPDQGSIEMKGRVSSLIELGAGFHPDMSGRENIYINASIFGLSRNEIDKRLANIIQFSELEEYLDNPVRTYSSGMYMRLAFAVAINVDADILLIDEILAVGDANFQAKCLNKIQEIKKQGATVVLVSHSLSQIEQICDRTIWIDEGMIREQGRPREVHNQYLQYMGEKRELRKEKEHATVEKEKNSDCNGKSESYKIMICSLVSIGVDGKEKSVFSTGEDIRLKFQYKAQEQISETKVAVTIIRNDGVKCYQTNSFIDLGEYVSLKTSGEIELKLEHVDLLQGEYGIEIGIYNRVDATPISELKQCKIEMISSTGDSGVARINHTWKISR